MCQNEPKYNKEELLAVSAENLSDLGIIYEQLINRCIRNNGNICQDLLYQNYIN